MISVTSSDRWMEALTVRFSSDKIFPLLKPSHADSKDDWRTIIFMEFIIQLQQTNATK